MSEPREIPIRDRGDAPLITTTAKVIAFAIILLSAVVTLNWWLARTTFEQSVDSRFDRFELRLTKEYVPNKDIKDLLPRPEYELRHAELIERDRQINERVKFLEDQISKLTEQVSRLTELVRVLTDQQNRLRK